MAEKTNTMASHRMTPVSENPGSKGAYIRALPEEFPTMMPSELPTKCTFLIPRCRSRGC